MTEFSSAHGEEECNRIRLMYPASRYDTLLFRGGLCALGLSVGAAALLLSKSAFLPDVPSAILSCRPAGPARPWYGETDPASVDWSVFRGREETGSAGGGALSKRFRLAGTYFRFDDGGMSDVRMGILEDLMKKEQHIVRENEEVGGVKVLRLFSDRVVLAYEGGEEDLWLSFSGPAQKGAGVTGTGRGDEAGQRATRFGGKRLGKNSWLFQREGLIDYYRDLMNDPARLTKVFDTMKPVRNPEGKIEGYRVGIEGEHDFFDSVGLREGDVVREVNGMAMTNRRLAEYFIGEFVKGRASAFVLGVDRGGVRQKQVYQVRGNP